MLEDHLDQLRKQGKLDSEGFFTLDLRSRDRKTFEFYKAQDVFWQLKFVQLAVLYKAGSITVTNSKETLKLRAGDLSQSVPYGEGAPLRTVLAGCLALDRTFVVTQYGPEPWRLMIKEGSLLEASAPPVSRVFRLVIEGPGHGDEEAGFWQRWFSRSRETADWVKLLNRRCQSLPIPMKIDGLAVQQPHRFGFRPLAVLQVKPSWDLFLSDWIGTSSSEATATFKVSEPSLQALIGLPDLPGGPTTIYLLRDGIFLHAYRKELGWPGTEVLLDCPALRTDATTLQIVEDDTFFDLMRRLENLIRKYGRRAYEKAEFEGTLEAGSLRALRSLELGP